MKYNSLFPFILLLLLFSCERGTKFHMEGEARQWHKLTFIVPGPEVSEQSDPNPFLDYRLEMVFSRDDREYRVPGYFAADGNAAETGAKEGSIWKVHFNPDKTGEWNYSVSFRTGKNISINNAEGKALEMDGQKGSFMVSESDKNAKDFRFKGRLERDKSSAYLKHAGSGELFVKGGADSPENFLGYVDFDGSYYGGNNKQRSGEDAPNAGLHRYEAHEKDWKPGDSEWKDGKGKGIIGALNYLASKKINSVYFLTLNILGDGEDVWPYTDRNERYRFDCSKLDQWEVVFSHMDSLGIMMHVVLQETENEQVLDGGYLDVQRKLYLRELIARFSHHNAITWNLGEEHGPVEWMPYAQSAEDTRKMARFIKDTDPYDHFTVVHTHPNLRNQRNYLPEYLGYKYMDGLSIQTGNPLLSHEISLEWKARSEEAGHPWVICIDEIGPHWKGALPDEIDPAHDTIRKQVLWANLMAGGGGVEWYFGYKYPHGDLNCEDFRSRDKLWEQTSIATGFFMNELPLANLQNRDDLVNDAWCLSDDEAHVLIYYPDLKKREVDLSAYNGSYSVRWFNPRQGGSLEQGTLATLVGGSISDPGLPYPDADLNEDWLCYIRK